MARLLNPSVFIMRALIVAAILLLTACRGEPVPRDYQNAPPDMTHAAQSKTDAPSNATVETPPEPSTGGEGPNPVAQPVAPPAQPTTTTMADTPPTTTT
jgi:PBP1b-binding outer membrane lipoprotein LpoB